MRAGNGSDAAQYSQRNSGTSKIPYVDGVFSPRVILNNSVAAGERTAQSHKAPIAIVIANHEVVLAASDESEEAKDCEDEEDRSRAEDYSPDLRRSKSSKTVNRNEAAGSRLDI